MLILLRDLSESLAYRVSWDGKKKEIEIYERGTDIRLVIGSDIAQVNGAEVKLDVGAQIHEGTTYVPLRFVGEAFNMSVDWDSKSQSFNYEKNYGLIEQEDLVILNHVDHLKVYDDKTGSLIKSYNLNDFQEGLNLDLMKMNTHYIMGRHKSTIHVIDLETGKVTRILDLIPEVDQYYVFESDMYLSTDHIDLVHETDTELVFKYYSVSEQTEKTVTCKLGK